MKKSNEQKPTLVNRFVHATLKLTNTRLEHRSISPIEHRNYVLPKSFLAAVDRARAQAGYDILPRHHNRSASSCLSKSLSLHTFRTKIFHSSSTSNIDDNGLKKIPFRRRPRHQAQQQISNPIWKPSSMPIFRMTINPSMMISNRFRHPVQMIPMRTPQSMFAFRFR
jgi:hypothetical protein